MIDLTVHRQGLEHNIRIARENGVVIPTFENMIHPETVPQPIRDRLTHVGLWDVDPANLFRITWKNEPVPTGGLYRSAPNYIELPPALTGVPARILCLPGKWFPTGCHKVGASFGCLAPRLVTGQFDASSQKAVWPSTGNYCRGGAFNSKLLGVHGVAILPAGMSQERFDWLASIDADVIKTPGCESNVKEIFDKTNELSRDPSCMIFNQFAEMGNHLWHYKVTGAAVAEAFEDAKRPGDRLAGACFTSGSAGTIGCGDYLKEVYPAMKLAVGEAVQCPTILNNGFGDHRVEGIGDKHVPWIHDVKNTDMVVDVDDNDAMALLRLFNEPAGKAQLMDAGVDPQLVEQLSLMGISGIANVLCCIKLAKYYELTGHDVVCTVLTDSADMYRSRLAELTQQLGEYDAKAAAYDFALHLMGLKTDCMAELGYYDRKRVHNLKYYTWVEQQGKTTDELDALWYGTEWADVHSQADALDELIRAFNEETGVLKGL
ncbi:MULTISPECIES: pyridoxal-phosphate dependent enzyme [unclassified Flavonifractor]|uniref:pyridoxal-phosphate dependent enzyme n=1 Tax=unclassified Flavonifractor TaxID=2629267 RepID=UPI000B3A975D|nr:MULTISPECIES: pyridoxal-phosphate dependent enzyme [unclassified Flavonifractor]OUN11585.1 pyridoxal-5-phosphate-dependent protein subunit beta [Flavonifractor sp. An9]OUO17850.1 pyridoxal-5-phosphate-dependent protein subunit beta [Flavonifractor sp. An4]